MRWLALMLAMGVACGQQEPGGSYRRAWQLVGQGRAEEAIPLLRAITDSGNTFAPAYRLLAEAFQYGRLETEGELYFRGLIARRPDRGGPYYGLALMLGAADRRSEMLRAAADCVVADSTMFQCHDIVASALGKFSGGVQTIQSMQKIIPLTAGGPEAEFAVLTFYVYQQDWKSAVVAGEKAVQAAAAADKLPLLAAAEYWLAYVIAVTPGANAEQGRRYAEQACRHAGNGSAADVEFSLCLPITREVYPSSARSAQSKFLELIERAGSVENPRLEADLESRLAKSLAGEGLVEEALEHNQKATVLSSAIKRSPDLANQQMFSGELYMRIGMHPEAIAAFEKALQAASAVGSDTFRAHTLAKLTVAHSQVGNALEAIRTAEEAIRLFRERGMNWQAGAELSDVGMAYLTLGDTATAIRYFREALESGRHFHDSGEIVRNSNLLAEALLARGQAGEAEMLLKQTLGLLGEVREEQFEVRTRTLLGEAHSLRKEYGEALKELHAAFGIVRRMRNAWAEADLHQRMGRHFLRAGDVTGAEKSFEACLAIAEAASMVKLMQEARVGLAEVARRRNQPEQAVEWLKKAVAALESVRMGAPGPELRAGLLRKNWAVYEELIELLGEMHRRRPGVGYDREALTFSERGRARVLLDLLEESRAGLRLGLTPEQAARQRSLERQMAAALDRLSKENSAGARAEVEQAERALQQWATELRVTNPRYHGLKYPEPLDAEGVRRLAAERGLTIVEYSLGRRSSRVWVAGRGELWSAALPAEGVIAAEVRKLRESLSEHPRGAAAERYQEPARELYRMLIGPVRARLGKGARVVIVPDGILHYLPFEALLGQDDRFLLEEAAISYAPSASVLAELQRGPPGRGGREVLALGNPDFGRQGTAAKGEPAEVVRAVYGASGLNLRPLPGTEKEVRSIAALYPGALSKVLVGREASEQALKAEPLAGYRRLHLATHALIDERAPARSGIVLSLINAVGEDGVLRISEIMDLPLKAELVVLSACQTGLGTLVRGEGMVGFTRAFLYAGAERVAVSLWPVNDGSTPEIMEGFYRGMRGGMGVAEALRAAKVGMVRSGVAGYRHPYYWAGFVVVGGR
jgi:CHAT domain-containing protein/predicted negative regulator of RcsB-dependent stress response